jgi:hypothetical protein
MTDTRYDDVYAAGTAWLEEQAQRPDEWAPQCYECKHYEVCKQRGELTSPELPCELWEHKL